jgi:hypothetical protein
MSLEKCLYPLLSLNTESQQNKQNKLHGLSPRANYTDRATTACRRSDCQLLRIEGATWSTESQLRLNWTFSRKISKFYFWYDQRNYLLLLYYNSYRTRYKPWEKPRDLSPAFCSRASGFQLPILGKFHWHLFQSLQDNSGIIPRYFTNAYFKFLPNLSVISLWNGMQLLDRIAWSSVNLGEFYMLV